MILFRTASHTDVLALEKLINSAYRGEHSKKGWTTEADLLGGQRTDAQTLTEILETPDNQIEIMLDDNLLIGCAHLRIEAKSTLYFGMLTIEPTFQARGLGKLMINHIEKMGKRKNLHFIRMTVIQVRKELIAFYERRGFKASGNQQEFPSHDPRFGIPKNQELILIEYTKSI